MAEGTKISALTALAQALQATDYLPIVSGGATYKYAIYNYVVKNSGAETIADVKTFSSSPIVPTPTTDMQASTKKYVDDTTGTVAGNLTTLVSSLGTAAYLDKGAVNGVASLDSTGKIPSTELPPITITDTFVVASESAMLTLTAEVGDVAVRTDETKSYILQVSPASTLSNWVYLQSPSAAVTSVDGRTGAVTLSDVYGSLANTPTADQKAALEGTSGTPSASNKFVTADDNRVPIASGSAPVYGCRGFGMILGDVRDDVSATYSIIGTVCTITQTAHGHIVGHYIYCNFTTGTGVDGRYLVDTIIDANNFTIVHTSATTSGAVTLQRAKIQNGFNLHSVAYYATGFYMPNYEIRLPSPGCPQIQGSSPLASAPVRGTDLCSDFPPTDASCFFKTRASDGTALAPPYIPFIVFA